jgi:hypothetical protein
VSEGFRAPPQDLQCATPALIFAECPNGFGICNGNGVCDYDTSIQRARCFCDLGWSGVECDIPGDRGLPPATNYAPDIAGGFFGSIFAGALLAVIGLAVRTKVRQLHTHTHTHTHTHWLLWIVTCLPFCLRESRWSGLILRISLSLVSSVVRLVVVAAVATRRKRPLHLQAHHTKRLLLHLCFQDLHSTRAATCHPTLVMDRC